MGETNEHVPTQQSFKSSTEAKIVHKLIADQRFEQRKNVCKCDRLLDVYKQRGQNDLKTKHDSIEEK